VQYLVPSVASDWLDRVLDELELGRHFRRVQVGGWGGVGGGGWRARDEWFWWWWLWVLAHTKPKRARGGLWSVDSTHYLQDACDCEGRSGLVTKQCPRAVRVGGGGGEEDGRGRVALQ
jgi:hypothetical protein